jgi:hypothetical protein
MPQDKQNEINLEISRDYYSASDMTLVLSDHEYNIPDQYRMWSMISDVIQSGTGFTLQFEWISKNPTYMRYNNVTFIFYVILYIII